MADGGYLVKKNSANRRTPRFYLDVAKVLKVIDDNHSSVKNALFNTKLRSNSRSASRLNAAVCRVLKHRDLLDHVIDDTAVGHDSYACDRHLLRFLVSELLLNCRPIHGTSHLVTEIKLHSVELKRALKRHLKTRGFKRAEDLLVATADSQLVLPRYVRVNTLLTTVDDVVYSLLEEGFEKVFYSRQDIPYEEYIDSVKYLRKHEFVIDIHFEDVLVFHPSVSFFGHRLYEEGHVILQDKASCFPVHLLAPRRGKIVLDACAAPGMKATLLAAFMENTGTLLACDLDQGRVETLRVILDVTGVQCAEVSVQNFTQIDPTKKPHKKVKYILLDPSCSGTGMVSDRQNFGDNPLDSVSDKRLQSLALFQLAMLRHALSFPRVKRVSYSTCSILEEENEAVVTQCLQEFGDRFRLLEPPDSWPVFRDPDGKYANLTGLCVKTVPERDLTNGFFVAVFKRSSTRTTS